MDLSLTGGFSIDLRQLLAISVFPWEYLAYSPRRYAHVYILLQALLVACENIRFSSLFAAGDVRAQVAQAHYESREQHYPT